MSPQTDSRLPLVGALVIIGAIALLFILSQEAPLGVPKDYEEAAQIAGSAPTIPPPLPPPVSIPSQEPEETSTTLPTRTVERGPVSPLPTPQAENALSSVVRIQYPYDIPPQSFLTVNENARLALVNILCAPESGNGNASSGSGIIIDSRGVILTNAHVAQYVLLAQTDRTNLSCVVRTGAPARVIGSAEILYIPPVWVKEHAEDVAVENPKGTGEHDYALLRITSTPDAHALYPASFGSLPIDIRDAIGFPNDSVLAASYPSEFVGARATAFSLYPASSITSVRGLLTFKENTVDLLSLAGVQEAQSGSSGGAVVNAWGYLIGIITTTSEGATTAEREMRALTLSYIDRDLHEQSGVGIAQFLSGDVAALAERFEQTSEDPLADLLIAEIEK